MADVADGVGERARPVYIIKGQELAHYLVAGGLGDLPDVVLQTRALDQVPDGRRGEASAEEAGLEPRPRPALQLQQALVQQEQVHIDDVVQWAEAVVGHHDDGGVVCDAVEHLADEAVYALVDLPERRAEASGGLGVVAGMGGINELPEGVLHNVGGLEVEHQEVVGVVGHQPQRIFPPPLDQVQQVGCELRLVALFVLNVRGDAVGFHLASVTVEQVGRVGEGAAHRGEHPGDDESVDRSGRVGDGDIHHANLPAGLGEDLPQRRSADGGGVDQFELPAYRPDEVEHAMLARVLAGSEGGPGRRGDRRERGFQRAVDALGHQPGQVGQVSCLRPGPDQVEGCPVNSDDQYTTHSTSCSPSSTWRTT